MAVDATKPSADRRSMSPRRLVLFAWIACGVVLGLGYLLEITAALRGTWSDQLDFEFIRLDSEGNLPSAYSSGMMVLIAVLMFRAFSRERRLGLKTATAWSVLGGIFIYLALDELIAIHEHFIDAGFLPHFDSFFHFRWVILGIGLVVIVFGVFLPFLFRLPRPTAIRLFIAGAIYVSGVLGMEMIGGYILETIGQRTVLYSLETILEETLEDVGLVLALRTMILHLAEILPPPRKPAAGA